VRPERFELPAFWFVVGKAGNPKALQVSRLQAAPASKSCLRLVHKLVHTCRVHEKGAQTGDETLTGPQVVHCITATNDKQFEITRGFWSTALSASVRTF